jgi:hypothetical protein
MTAPGSRRTALAATAVIAVAWLAALAASTATGRAMYGDGAYYVLVHLVTPHRFNDYDFQRSFASFVSQSPILLGQRLGLQGAAAYAALYGVGAFVFPALAMIAALFLARRQPVLFAANAFAIAVYGFGTNFINTEANLMFGLVWLAATIMALDRPAPVLRGFLVPMIAFALLRCYEGMLLAGPVLAAWALLGTRRAASDTERFGLLLAALLFTVAAIVGLGGFLSPRDPNNASGFVASAFRYLRNPHAFLLASAALAMAAAFAPPARSRALAVLAAASGVAVCVGVGVGVCGVAGGGVGVVGGGVTVPVPGSKAAVRSEFGSSAGRATQPGAPGLY